MMQREHLIRQYNLEEYQLLALVVSSVQSLLHQSSSPAQNNLSLLLFLLLLLFLSPFSPLLGDFLLLHFRTYLVNSCQNCVSRNEAE